MNIFLKAVTIFLFLSAVGNTGYALECKEARRNLSRAQQEKRELCDVLMPYEGCSEAKIRLDAAVVEIKTAFPNYECLAERNDALRKENRAYAICAGEESSVGCLRAKSVYQRALNAYDSCVQKCGLM